MNPLRRCFYFLAAICAVALTSSASAETFKIQIGFSDSGEGQPARVEGKVIAIRRESAFLPQTQRVDASGYANFELERGTYIFLFDGDGDEAGLTSFAVDKSGVHMARMSHGKERGVMVMFFDLKTSRPFVDKEAELPKVPGFQTNFEFAGWAFSFPDPSKTVTHTVTYTAKGYFPATFDVSMNGGPKAGVDFLLVPVRPRTMGIQLFVKVETADGKPVEKADVRLIGPKGGPGGNAAGITDARGRASIVVPDGGKYTMVTTSTSQGVAVDAISLNSDKSGTEFMATIQTSTESMIYVIHVDKANSTPIPGVSLSVPVSQGVTKSNVTDDVIALRIANPALHKFNIFSQHKGHESKRTTLTIPTVAPGQPYYNVIIVSLGKG